MDDYNAVMPGGLAGPPLPPPETAPTLSALPPPGMGGMDVPPGPGRAGALPGLFMEAMTSLKTIARVVPDASEELDECIARLRGILSRTLRGEPMGTPPSEQGGPY